MNTTFADIDNNIESYQTMPLVSVQRLMLRVLLVVAVLFIFLLALELLGKAFQLFNPVVLESFVSATINPFINLFVGVLATAILQSSSVTTSMVVALVHTGTLSLTNAVPFIVGANIGTTITVLLLSFAHITKKKEFKRALTVASSHSFFNLFTALLFFPLEYWFGFLSKFATQLALWIDFNNGSGEKVSGILDITVRPIANALVSLLGNNPWWVLLFAVPALFFSIYGFTKALQSVVIGHFWRRINTYIFGKSVYALFWGTSLTAILQSSSVTTCFIVPLAATGKVSVKRVFPFILGANIGTTLTAVIASISRTDAAFAIALVHVLFNVLGVLVFFFMSFIPIACAQWLGNAALKNRMVAFVYVLLIFFLIPLGLIFLTTFTN